MLLRRFRAGDVVELPSGARGRVVEEADRNEEVEVRYDRMPRSAVPVRLHELEAACRARFREHLLKFVEGSR